MDPVTTAIMGAVGAGVTKVGTTAIMDGYGTLKDLIAARFGEDSDVAKAVENAQANPGSKDVETQLDEQIKASGANLDPEVQKAAKQLLAALSAQPGNEKALREALESYIEDAEASGSTSSKSNGSTKSK